MRHSIRTWLPRAVVAAAVVACGGGGGGDGPTGPGPGPGPGPGTPSPSATVTMGASSFSPASVSITRSGTATWNNTSGISHNVTFAAVTGAPSNIPDHTSGSNQRTFGTTGTFNYQCTLHGGMAGSVSVQ